MVEKRWENWMTIDKKLGQLSMEDLRSIGGAFEIHSHLALLTLSRYEREVYIELYCRAIPGLRSTKLRKVVGERNGDQNRKVEIG